MSPLRPDPRWLLHFVIAALAYYAGGRIGLQVPYVGSHITLIWPPTGIALALLLRWNLSLWPAVWLGAFAVNLAIGSSPLLAAGIACGNTLGPWLAVRALHRLEFDAALPRRRDLLLYLAIGVLGGMLITATNGVLQLWLAGVLPAPAIVEAWLTWWLGDAMGALVVGIPLLCTTRRYWRGLFRGRRGVELAAVLALTLLIGAMLFPAHAAGSPANPALYLPFLLLCWLGIRGGAGIASTAALLLAGEAVWATAGGAGPFQATDIHVSLALLWGYMATATIIAVLITALVGELLTSERRLTIATVGAQMGLWEWDIRSDQVVCSGDFEALGGIAAEHVNQRGQDWAGVIHPDDWPGVERRIAAHLVGTSEVFEAEYRMSARAGSWVWVLSRGQIVERDGRGSPLRMAGTLLNIAERKRGEAALAESQAHLRASEERYRLLLDNSPVGILHFDPALVVTYSNERFEDIMQVPRGYMPGLDCSRLRDQSVVPAMRRAVAGEVARYEGPYTTNYGGIALWISMTCAPLRSEDGQILGGVVVLEDISARVRTEAVERRQRECLARLNEIAALSHLPLAEQLRRALAIVAAQLGLELGIVSAVEGQRYTVVVQVSPADALHDGQVFALGDTYCDITLSQDTVVAISDMSSSPHRGHPCYAAFGLEAYIGAPVQVGGEVYGTVNFSSAQPYARGFDAADEEFVRLLARWVGSAIEREQARTRLAASEAHLHAIIENEPECVKVVDRAGRLVQMNRAGFEMLEVASVDEANADGLIRFVDPEHRAAFRALAERVFAGETGTLEFMVQGRRGTRRWLDTHAAPLRDAAGEIGALLAVTRDISARKAAEAQLRLAASVFTHAHEGIMICDAERVVLDVNPTFSEITGYAREDVVGRTPRLLGSGRQDAAFYRAMWQAIEAEGHWDGEVWNRRKDGTAYAERLTISAVHDEQGAVAHYIGTFSDITLLKEQQARLERQAHYDALTQLPNRALLADRLAQALAQARRAGTQVAVCYLDLDGFKAVNDQLGHNAGDTLLVEVARRLGNAVRAGDTVARLGGDEFVLVLVGIRHEQECHRALARVLNAIAAPVRIGTQQRSVSGSIGVTLFPADDRDPDTLLRHADQAMYAAKQAGKSRYELYDPAGDERARGRREERERIEAALAAGEFRLHYQPIVDMGRGQVVGFEGLIRWQHPERGLLAPDEFLPLVHGSAVDLALGRWVLAEGVRQLATWRAAGITAYLGLNVTAEQLRAPGFVDEAAALLAAHPSIEPHALQLEISEAATLKDLDGLARLFERCKELGIDIALDDFGAGYSTLSYFRRLPVNTLKIDREFVRSALGNAEDLAVVDSVISLTQAFERKLVAKGVETPELGMLLLGLGCEVAQGFGIARPMPAEAVPAWVAGFVPDPQWAGRTASEAREDVPLLTAELDHRSWVRQMVAWVEADPDTQAPPTLDRSECRFGRWYGGEGAARYGRYAPFRAMGEIHDAVHRLGHELVDLQTVGRHDEARARVGELTTLQERLIDQIVAVRAAIAAERV